MFPTLMLAAMTGMFFSCGDNRDAYDEGMGRAKDAMGTYGTVYGDALNEAQDKYNKALEETQDEYNEILNGF